MLALKVTRKHSGRMRTVRCIGRRGCLPQCMLGYLPGVSAPVHAGIPAWGLSAPVHAGIPAWGVSAPMHAGIHPRGQNS